MYIYVCNLWMLPCAILQCPLRIHPLAWYCQNQASYSTWSYHRTSYMYIHSCFWRIQWLICFMHISMASGLLCLLFPITLLHTNYLHSTTAIAWERSQKTGQNTIQIQHIIYRKLDRVQIFWFWVYLPIWFLSLSFLGFTPPKFFEFRSLVTYKKIGLKLVGFLFLGKLDQALMIIGIELMVS